MTDASVWIQPFGEVFLRLDRGGVIRQAAGAVEDVLSTSVDGVQGLSWQQLAARFASDTARPGLLYAWEAIAGQRVAPAHYPSHFPFRPGLIVRLRPLAGDPHLAFVAQLAPSYECDLGGPIATSVLDAVMRLVKLGQNVSRGIAGPLTDRQVTELDGLVEGAEHVEQLLKDWRAELLYPCVTAPLPHLLTELLNFSIDEFSHRRVTTHELSIRCMWSPVVVYCSPTLRATVSDILLALLSSVAAQSTITLSDRAGENTVEVEIHYETPDPALQVAQRLEPLALADPARFGPLLSIQNLITSAQACLRPVGGRAWAEPGNQASAARLVLAVPRWRSTAVSTTGKT